MRHRLESSGPAVPLPGADAGTQSWYGLLLNPLLLVLIIANTVHFALFEGLSKALDALAWLLLLLLFLTEPHSHRLRHPHLRLALHAARLLAVAGVLLATAAYVFEENLLDAVNSAIWIAVIVMLELQVRSPEAAAHRTAFAAAAVVLYGALMVLVFAWAVRGEWFDAYDALLWLAAFGTIELDVLGARRHGPNWPPNR